MASWDDDRSLEEVAALATALAHPIRVAILRSLRQEPVQEVAALRRSLEPEWIVDTRGILHHLAVMARASVLDIRGPPARTGASRRPAAVRLLRNVRLQTHAA